MKHLVDILTGKNYRYNLLDGVVLTAPLGRFKKWQRSRDIFLQKFCFAVLMQVRSGVRYLIFESTLSDYRELSKEIPSDRIRDLAAFLGWHSAWRAESFLISDLEPSDDKRIGLEADIPQLAEVLYPSSGKAQIAIARFRDADAEYLNHAIDSTQLAVRRSELFDGLVGFVTLKLARFGGRLLIGHQAA